MRAGPTRWSSACSATTAPGAGCSSAARRIIGPSGEFEGYIGTCIDITEHRETVEQLRESRARFKTLAESLPQMIWTCLRDGYTDYLSPAVARLHRPQRSAAARARAGWSRCIPTIASRCRWSGRAWSASGDAYDLSFRIRRFDGVYRWFKTRAVPLRDPAGRILKWFGSNTDIEDFVHRRAQAQGAARAHAAAGPHHACHRRSPGTAQGVRSGAAQSRGRISASTSAACASTRPSPQLLTVTCVGRTQRGARRRRSASSSRRRSRWTKTALSRCVRGELVYEPDIETAQLALPRAARRAAACARWWPRRCMIEERGVRRAAGRASGAADSFSSDDCEFLRQLSSHVALAAHQARLYGALQGAYQDLRQTQQTVMQQERLRALGQIASGIAHDINNALSPAALYTQSHAHARDRALSERSREQLARDPARHRRRGAHRAAHARVLHAARPGAHAGARRCEPGPRAGHRPHARALEQHAAGTRRGGAGRERARAGSAEDPRRRKRGARRADQPPAERRGRDARRRQDHAAHARRRARQRK